MSRRKVLEKFEWYKEETEERIQYGIEHHRKGNFKLTVVDSEGKPVKNAKIHLSQKKHEFKFGANMFMLDELETPEKNELYKKYFAELFNIATVPFFWGDLEPERGKPRYDKDSPKIYRRPPIDLCLEFCEANGIEPREHGLSYEHYFPQWFHELPLNEAKKAFRQHCKEIAERYADRIPTMEVVNEVYWPNQASTALYNEDDYMEWAFKVAEQYFPDNELVVNEGYGKSWAHDPRNRHKYYLMIERAIARGARIDAIGLQYHMFHKPEDEYRDTRRYYSPRHLYAMMDRYADFKKPLQLTEVTVPAYSYDAEDEEIQTEILRNLYRVWFSHENMEQILYWNLVDGYAAFAPLGDFSAGENFYRGGLIRFDMTPKPAYYALKELLQKEWHTEADVETDENGVAYFKGFYGDYEAKIGEKSYDIKAYKKLALDNEYNKRIAKIIVK